MKSKEWISCGDCKYLHECKCGQLRIQNVDADSKIYNDIGCFDYEQYSNNKQLKLF
ncbi:MAG: hypothetical protein PHC34_09715 [Candidatus Gastranaerophilales bacterium]|nr:hypothetical protein [Candidatus Gastranaerophilales bacterium]